MGRFRLSFQDDICSHKVLLVLTKFFSGKVAVWDLHLMKKEEGRRKKEEGRRKKEEGRRKKEEGRRKKEEGRRKKEENQGLWPLTKS
jgi:hypothetical protein